MTLMWPIQSVSREQLAELYDDSQWFPRPRELRDDDSLAPDEDPALFGPYQCGECAGNDWTICDTCGRRGSHR